MIAEALGIEIPDFDMPCLKSPAESLQGDSRVAAIFKSQESRVKGQGRGVKSQEPRTKNQEEWVRLNLNDAPDLVPAVAVGLCVAGIPFEIEGVAHLRHKETDRMAAIATELRRLGFVLTTGDDTMAWDGTRCEAEEQPLIRTYLDHRMAMAFAPARLAFPNLKIEDPTVVAKSFPNYWNELSKLI